MFLFWMYFNWLLPNVNRKKTAFEYSLLTTLNGVPSVAITVRVRIFIRAVVLASVLFWIGLFPKCVNLFLVLPLIKITSYTLLLLLSKYLYTFLKPCLLVRDFRYFRLFLNLYKDSFWLLVFWTLLWTLKTICGLALIKEHSYITLYTHSCPAPDHMLQHQCPDC